MNLFQKSALSLTFAAFSGPVLAITPVLGDNDHAPSASFQRLTDTCVGAIMEPQPSGKMPILTVNERNDPLPGKFPVIEDFPSDTIEPYQFTLCATREQITAYADYRLRSFNERRNAIEKEHRGFGMLGAKMEWATMSANERTDAKKAELMKEVEDYVIENMKRDDDYSQAFDKALRNAVRAMEQYEKQTGKPTGPTALAPK